MGSIFKIDDEKSQRVKKLATELSLKYNVDIDILLLAWILKHPSGILPVCGTADKTRITSLMKATEIEMDLQDWFAFWIESDGKDIP
jgi:predicted oxidoreductase